MALKRYELAFKWHHEAPERLREPDESVLVQSKALRGGGGRVRTVRYRVGLRLWLAGASPTVSWPKDSGREASWFPYKRSSPGTPGIPNETDSRSNSVKQRSNGVNHLSRSPESRQMRQGGASIRFLAGITTLQWGYNGVNRR